VRKLIEIYGRWEAWDVSEALSAIPSPAEDGIGIGSEARVESRPRAPPAAGGCRKRDDR
jgi:hypothetical protein